MDIYQQQYNQLISGNTPPYHIPVPQKLHAKIKISNLTHMPTHTHLNCTCYDFSTKVLRLQRDLQSLSWSRQLQTFYKLKLLSYPQQPEASPFLGHVTELLILRDLFTIQVNIYIILPPSPLSPFWYYDDNLVKFLVSSMSH
jgi:hypothetical protein